MAHSLFKGGTDYHLEGVELWVKNEVHEYAFSERVWVGLPYGNVEKGWDFS